MISLLLLSVPFNDILQAILILLFSAIIILLSMINFQIMFYNDARLAGYAFHFTLLFLAIMSLNYHFVGPLISVLLIGFYFYKNVRYFYTC